MKLDKISLDSLKGVGSKMQEKLERLGLATVQDLLFHLPLRYEDRTQVWPIGDLPPGLHGAVEGEIQDYPDQVRKLLARIHRVKAHILLKRII